MSASCSCSYRRLCRVRRRLIRNGVTSIRRHCLGIITRRCSHHYNYCGFGIKDVFSAQIKTKVMRLKYKYKPIKDN